VTAAQPLSGRVAVLSRILGSHPAAMARLREAGLEVIIDLPGYEALGGDQAAWHRILATVQGLVVGLQPLPAAAFEAAASLRYVLRIGTGVDNIDVAAAAARGITVESLPGLNAPAVAEYAFGLMLAAARRIPEADRSLRAGEWTRFPGVHLGGRALGLIGYGEIARLMVPKAHGFGMDILVYRRSAGPVADGARRVSLSALLRQSDFISVHVPLTDQTRGLIGRREFGLMRDGVVLVNTARGAVIDEAELYRALAGGKVAACGLDVFEHEPPGRSPLLTLPNVVVSPHNGGYSDVATERSALTAASRLIDGLSRAARTPASAP
jgi:phosphoglycerate dehydrogenase-like enzyme